MTPSLSRITRELLYTFGRYPRKNLGQHFLTDPGVLQRILSAAELGKDDLVVEIGSGMGVVTAEIAKQVFHVIAIEIDSAAKPWSLDKLRHAASAGMHAIWIRWGDGLWAGAYDDVDVIQLPQTRKPGSRAGTNLQQPLWPDRARF